MLWLKWIETSNFLFQKLHSCLFGLGKHFFFQEKVCNVLSGLEVIPHTFLPHPSPHHQCIHIRSEVTGYIKFLVWSAKSYERWGGHPWQEEMVYLRVASCDPRFPGRSWGWGVAGGHTAVDNTIHTPSPHQFLLLHKPQTWVHVTTPEYVKYVVVTHILEGHCLPYTVKASGTLNILVASF